MDIFVLTINTIEDCDDAYVKVGKCGTYDECKDAARAEWNALAKDYIIGEFDKNEFKSMVDTLDAMSEDEYNEKCKDEWGVKPEDYPKDYTVELFKQWLNETPETSSYVRISWF